MLYTVNIQDEKIKLGAYYVFRHYSDDKFLNRIRAVEKFNHTELNSYDVAYTIEFGLLKKQIEIRPYKSVNPWSKAIAYAKDDKIFINTRKKFGVLDRVETIFHESMHLIGFSHDGNFVTDYNLKTVPYLAANIFANYIKEIYDLKAW